VIVVVRECRVVVAVERTRRGGSAGTRGTAGLLFAIPPSSAELSPAYMHAVAMEGRAAVLLRARGAVMLAGE
jgi:hypothetical protein